MKVKFLATGDGPQYYTFNGDVITAHKDDQSESFDLSGLETGGEFLGFTVDTLPLAVGHIMRNPYRDSNGELHVQLCQPVGANDWKSADAEIDSADYDPSQCYVKLVGISRSNEDVNNYEPVWNDEKGTWVAKKKDDV